MVVLRRSSRETAYWFSATLTSVRLTLMPKSFSRSWLTDRLTAGLWAGLMASECVWSRT